MEAIRSLLGGVLDISYVLLGSPLDLIHLAVGPLPIVIPDLASFLLDGAFGLVPFSIHTIVMGHDKSPFGWCRQLCP